MEIKSIRQTPHDMCTGCAACMNCCPVDAIKMLPDSEGFLCPEIDETKCVHCGKCAEICPVLKEHEDTGKEPECYAAWSKDEEIRFNSTSGGVFTHLASTVIKQGGTVVGARYREDHLVEHALIRKSEDIDQLRQSKYVQSEIGFVYREIKQELKYGKPLLFAGTPCQCAGLKAYLGKDYENLFLCDFICRGVNSPLVYLSYLRELEERYGSKVKRVWFKNKTFGWNNFATKIIFEDGQEYIADRETDPFMLGYIKSKTTLYMRECCYQCHFKGIGRTTDITLADFWGVEKQYPDIDTKDGVSAVMIHSEKGKKAFVDSQCHLDFVEANVYDIVPYNRCIIDNAVLGGERNNFFKLFVSDGFFNSLQEE